MIEQVKILIFINLIVNIILLNLVLIMAFLHYKREIKHKQEKSSLEQSRDYHIKELQKRSSKDADLY